MIQSSRALGISTLQLEADSAPHQKDVSKRATNLSGLGGEKSKSLSKVHFGAKGAHTRSLVARLPVPSGMDQEKARHFNI